ncbi:MAG: GNAT family N-acetyltransferase [Dehalococcoidales bacterium]|nr:GNAT family N-acetyltransferase [Dehalococcoidales bacterium]
MKFRKTDKLAGLKPLHSSIITGKKTRLREKKLSDVRNDYRWQSDPELSRLDAAPVLEMSFAIYLLDYSSVLSRRDTRFPLAIDTLEGRHIGNCTCYDIDEKKGEAQVGIMIGDRDYWDKGYGNDAVNTLVDHVFRNSSLDRLYLKTLDWNKRAHRCFEKCGFTDCGQLKHSGHNFILMELKREKWEKRQDALNDDKSR